MPAHVYFYFYEKFIGVKNNYCNCDTLWLEKDGINNPANKIKVGKKSLPLEMVRVCTHILEGISKSVKVSFCIFSCSHSYLVTIIKHVI